MTKEITIVKKLEVQAEYIFIIDRSDSMTEDDKMGVVQAAML